MLRYLGKPNESFLNRKDLAKHYNTSNLRPFRAFSPITLDKSIIKGENVRKGVLKAYRHITTYCNKRQGGTQKSRTGADHQDNRKRISQHRASAAAKALFLDSIQPAENIPPGEFLTYIKLLL